MLSWDKTHPDLGFDWSGYDIVPFAHGRFFTDELEVVLRNNISDRDNRGNAGEILADAVMRTAAVSAVNIAIATGAPYKINLDAPVLADHSYASVICREPALTCKQSPAWHRHEPGEAQREVPFGCSPCAPHMGGCHQS